MNAEKKIVSRIEILLKLSKFPLLDIFRTKHSEKAIKPDNMSIILYNVTIYTHPSIKRKYRYKELLWTIEITFREYE